jgi:hypothetical protein
MSDTETLSIEGFLSALAECGEDYLLVSQPDSATAHIRFPGTFEDAPVIWDATVRALQCRDGEHEGIDTPPRRQYIDIAPEGFPMRSITIGLNVTAIDPPVLLKTTIMIRKYKRLHAGRHEFGEQTPGK